MNERYNEEELKEFESLINKKLIDAEHDLLMLRKDLSNRNDLFLKAEMDTMTIEEIKQLETRQGKYIINLKNALIRIENKTYGVCRVTGKLIKKERLRNVPHATINL